jgi:protein-disulfide isomerase
VKPQLVEDYIEPGLVYMEYRDFAHIGEETIRAAEGAACAAEQDPDAYWDYNETLYQNQHTPPVNEGAYSDSRLNQIADELGLDVDAFESCMDDETYRDQIEASTAEAQETGITSTPQFQINGRIVEWDGYEALAAEIEAELDEQG